MKQTRQELIASGHFARLRDRNTRYIAATIEGEAAGEIRNLQSAYGAVLHSHLANGCIDLLLQDSIEKAREDFQRTVEWALKLIGAPPAAGGGVRGFDVEIELPEQGSRLRALNERKPKPGEERLSITEYHRALICVGCFGDRSEFPAVASVPEEAYRNPGTVASADYWARVRAWKALFLENDGEVRHDAGEAFAKGSGSGKPEAAALLALLDCDRDRFTRSLRQATDEYVKATARKVNDPITAVFFPGLLLCRMAIDRGLAVDGGPHLPIRVLPDATRQLGAAP